MDFITIPLVVGMICVGIYSLFELFVRKKERLTLIDKLGDKLDPTTFQSRIGLPRFIPLPDSSFSSLKIGCLLVGLGLGILVGFIITVIMNTGGYDMRWSEETVCGASVLLFGGLGLIASFLIEQKLLKKNDEK